MKRNLIVAFTIILMLATFAPGCINTAAEESSAEGTGFLKLNLAGTPIDANNVAGVYITINEIQYNRNGEWITAEEFGSPKIYNLLELAAGNFASLGQFELPAGYYVQIRLILDISEYGSTATDSGCAILFTDGSEKPLFVPSGGETGFKAIGAFEVPVNGTVEVTADFDVHKAVVEIEQSGVYNLKSTICLVENEQTGNISGSIADGSDYEHIIIYAYQDGTWSGEEDKEQIGNKSRFPGAVARADMDGDGNYNLALLGAGIYDLTVVGFNVDQLGEVLGFVSDVEVKKEKTTIQDIDIPLPKAPVDIVVFEGNKGVLLEWGNNTETDLDGYNVYCSTASGGPYIKIAEVKASKYNDNGLTNEVTYYYVVTAIDGSNNESVYSKEVSAKPSS